MGTQTKLYVKYTKSPKTRKLRIRIGLPHRLLQSAIPTLALLLSLIVLPPHLLPDLFTVASALPVASFSCFPPAAVLGNLFLPDDTRVFDCPSHDVTCGALISGLGESWTRT